MALELLAPRLPASQEEREVIAGYLNHRLNGIRNAVKQMKAATDVDASAYAVNSLAYYRNVEGYLVQTLYQLERTKDRS